MIASKATLFHGEMTEMTAHWIMEQDIQRQYVNMYMRRRLSLSSIGSEADGEDENGEESGTLLTNAIAQVKEFAQIMKRLQM